MSKPVTRIVFSVLICLAILAGIYISVQGAAQHVGVSSGKAQVTAGLMPDLSHYRTQASAVSGYYTGLLEERTTNKGHGCSSDSYSSTDE